MNNIEELHRSGKASIGTPDDAIALLGKILEQDRRLWIDPHSAHDWASFENTKKSFEMFARHVMPKFAGRNTQREDSLTWIRGQREQLAPRSARRRRCATSTNTSRRENAKEETGR